MFVASFFVICQAIGGYLSGSIAVFADCAHLASDTMGFGMSIYALQLTKRKASDSLTYGWHRAEIIGSVASVAFLIAITVWLLFEASKRFFIKFTVDGSIMLITAIVSVFFNLVLMNILHQGGHGHGIGGGCTHDHPEETKEAKVELSE